MMWTRTAPANDVCEYFGTVVRGLSTDAFRANGYGRRFAPHVAVDEAVVRDVFSRFGLVWEREEPMFGHFVGNNFLPGAAVHTHKDTAPAGLCHVRCNVAIKMPIVGGNPVLSGVELPVSEGEAWVCFASIEEHGSTPVESGTRVVVSLGGLVDKDKAEAVYMTLKAVH